MTHTLYFINYHYFLSYFALYLIIYNNFIKHVQYKSLHYTKSDVPQGSIYNNYCVTFINPFIYSLTTTKIRIIYCYKKCLLKTSLELCKRPLSHFISHIYEWTHTRGIFEEFLITGKKISAQWRIVNSSFICIMRNACSDYYYTIFFYT